jgi:hypothetical protein
MSLPAVLVRIGGDVVPVILGTSPHGSLTGYDLVRQRVVPVDPGHVVGAVSTDPAAVYWGMDLVESETRRSLPMAAEAPRRRYVSEASSSRSTDLDVFAAEFLANVESDGDPNDFIDDPRVPKILDALQLLGIQQVGDVLGAGTYGTAAELDETHVVKLTTDPSEVQAGHVLAGKKLRNVAHVDGAWFVRGVRAKTTILHVPDGQDVRKLYPVGIVILEHVQTLSGDETEELSRTVNEFKEATHTYPDQLARLTRAQQRDKLRQASVDLQSLLSGIAQELRRDDRVDEAYLAEGVASALRQLRSYGVYAIDVHGGNVGYSEDSRGDRVYKVFDIGSSSPPAKPKARNVDDRSADKLLRDTDIQLSFPDFLEEGLGAAEWVGHGVDELERAGSQNPTVVDAGAEEAAQLTSIETYKTWRIESRPYSHRGQRRYEAGIFGDLGLADVAYGKTRTEAVANAKAMIDMHMSHVRPMRNLGLDTDAWSKLWQKDAEEAHEDRKTVALAPQGMKFAPLDLPLFGALPVVTGYTQVRPQLEKHRAELPSPATIQLSTVFAGLSIMVGIDQAEQAFACVAKMYERLGRGRMPTIDEVRDCIVPLGIIKQRTLLYESAGAWAPVVREAMERGLRDRPLRRFLYLETETPNGIGLAKLSFVLALCGQDTVCLDSRLLHRMFGKTEGAKMSSSFNAQRSQATLARYESVEDAFLEGNPFYNASDPIGRARAQWISWEQSGDPPKPASHSVWLNVVR